MSVTFSGSMYELVNACNVWVRAAQYNNWFLLAQSPRQSIGAFATYLVSFLTTCWFHVDFDTSILPHNRKQ
jgi:hypothetical protein